MRHKWVDTELWDRKALKCSNCQLHIIDYPMPHAVKVDGSLLVTFNESTLLSLAQTDPKLAKWGRRNAKMGRSDKPPEGKPVRWQTSNVLNVDFTGKTKKEIVAYAEDPPNRACVGKRTPMKSANWLNDEGHEEPLLRRVQR